ncbi:MAG: hypothetical protein WDO18_17550 [Acidobacteriota bacterium]
MLKAKVTDAAPVINFTYGASQLAMSSWIGVLDPAYAGNDHLGMISEFYRAFLIWPGCRDRGPRSLRRVSP